jgi:hypothetical protein
LKETFPKLLEEKVERTFVKAVRLYSQTWRESRITFNENLLRSRLKSFVEKSERFQNLRVKSVSYCLNSKSNSLFFFSRRMGRNYYGG